MRFLSALMLLSLVGCASVSTIITGETREPIDPTQVKLYSEAPQNYTIIGIVIASSDAGLTAQDDINYAVDALRKQAAKLGANGILIDGVGSNSSSHINSNGMGGFYSSTSTEHTITAKAIYVSP